MVIDYEGLCHLQSLAHAPDHLVWVVQHVDANDLLADDT